MGSLSGLHYLNSNAPSASVRSLSPHLPCLTMKNVQGQSTSPVPFFIFTLLPVHRRYLFSAMLSSLLLLLSSVSQKHLEKNVVRPATFTEKQLVKADVYVVLAASKNKSGKTMEERLAREIITVVNGDSKAIIDRELAQKQAIANWCVPHWCRVTR